MNSNYFSEINDSFFSIEHIKISTGENMKEDDYHAFFEIYFSLGDEMSYFIGDKTFSVNKFDLVFIDKFTYHRTLYKSKGSRERILVLLNDKFFDCITDFTVRDKLFKIIKKKKISLPDGIKKRVADIFINNLLPAYYKSNSSVSIMKAKLIFAELLLTLVELEEKDVLIFNEPDITPQEKRVSEVINYINMNYQSAITLDFLSNHFYINKYYLCHTFKKITGTSIINFINNLRLAEAERLLRYSNHNISEISEIVGFNSINHFIELFKSNYDCTPKSFREGRRDRS